MGEKNHASGWRGALLVAIGVAVGALLAAPPVAGHVGGTVRHLWEQHLRPQADQRYVPARSSLRRGMTLQGNWAAYGFVPFAYDVSAISFGRPLAVAPLPHYIRRGATPPRSCPGNAANPRALPGHLCVYESLAGNVLSRSICNPIRRLCGLAANRYGAYVEIRGDNGPFNAAGTWAVTAR